MRSTLAIALAVALACAALWAFVPGSFYTGSVLAVLAGLLVWVARRRRGWRG